MKVDAFFWGLSPLYKTPSLHVIEKLAVSFNVQPYELLYPRELDAKNANSIECKPIFGKAQQLAMVI